MKFVHPKLTLIAVLVNRIIKNHTLSRYKTLSAVSIILAENNSQQMVLFLIHLEIVFLGGLVTAVVPSRINIPIQIRQQLVHNDPSLSRWLVGYTSGFSALQGPARLQPFMGSVQITMPNWSQWLVMEIHTGIRTQSVESSAISRDKTLQFRTLDARLKDSTGRLTNLNHGRMDLLQSERPERPGRYPFS